jgi:RNA polymerase-binding transcription factor DksA
MNALASDAVGTREEILAQLPARLRQRRSELAAALNEHLHHDDLGEHVGAGLPRRADETDDDAAAETQRERDVTDLARLTAELAQVDAALARVAAGEVGDCVDCGEPIPPARLHINPAAARCAECQEFVEQRQARERKLGH